MTFDEQLRRSLDTLTDRLRDEMSRQVQAVVDELAASAQAERDRVVAEAREEARAEGKEAEAQEARNAEQQESDRVSDDGAGQRLVESIRAMDEARTLTEILDTLAGSAAREAARVAVFTVRGGRYQGWRSIGFDLAFDRGASVELPPNAAVIPIAIGGEVVAALCTENAELSTENSELRTENSELGTPNFEPRSPNSEPGTPNPALEILARHAARCLESQTAFKAARAALASSAADRANGLNDDANADEDVGARRYARLLVSEIKLYHEPDVVAGRRERDLATRLGGEIARARVLYEQRVPPHIRQHADYFHDELVRTLADGDRSLMEMPTET